MVTGEMKRWETREGIHFLKKIGIRQGQAVVDFGCRVGRYSIPAALLVGPQGSVYAIDKDKDVLNTLKRKASALGIANIRTIETTGEIKLNVQETPVDVFLLYDVLHYMHENERKALYSEILQVLCLDSLLSIYPKHIATDNPADHFKNLRIDDIIRELEASGFSLEAKICGTMSHADSLVQGCILNFRKI